MTVEVFLGYLVKNNALLIELLGGLILALVGFLAYRNFSQMRDVELGIPSSSADLSQIEEMLKKILEKASLVPASLPPPPSGASASGASVNLAETAKLLEEISQLKKALEAKQTEMDQVKKAAADSGNQAPAMSSEEKVKLESQLKELNTKLSEYEIIAEDIADLSYYKEENQRLLKQLESMKSGVNAAAITGKITPESLLASTVTPLPPTPEPPPVTGEHAVESVVNDQVMEDFAKALTDRNASSLVPPPTPPMPEPTVAVAPPPPPPPPPEASAPVAISSDTAVKSEFDLDKMLEEASGLQAQQPTDQEINALNQEMDPNKLQAEADKLNAALAAQGGDSEKEKDLMGQFEDFIKKDV